MKATFSMQNSATKTSPLLRQLLNSFSENLICIFPRPLVFQRAVQDCHYEGSIKDMPNSSVQLSTCEGIL